MPKRIKLIVTVLFIVLIVGMCIVGNLFLRQTDIETQKLSIQNINEQINTVQGPMETLQKFLFALENKDIKAAVDCCVVPSEQINIIEQLTMINDRGLIIEMVSDLQNVQPEFVGETKVSYFFNVMEGDSSYKEYINFVKNIDGVWMIQSF